MEMAIKSPAQGRRAIAPSSPQGRLQREVHSIQRRCQETLSRAKARKVEMEQEEARRRTKMEGFRADIEENKRLREEARVKEEERKRKEEKKLRSEMKKDVEKMIKGVDEARKDFKKLFKPTIVPRVSLPSSVSQATQNDQACAPVPVSVPVVINSQGEKKLVKVLNKPSKRLVKASEKAPKPVKPLVNKQVLGYNKKSNLKMRSNKENLEKKILKEVTSIGIKGKHAALSLKKIQSNAGLKKDPKPDKAAGDEKKKEIKEGKKPMFQSEFLPSVFMHHKSFLGEDEDSFDAFLESFDAPKWADLHNLNDHDEDNIGFFFQSGCSQNLLP